MMKDVENFSSTYCSFMSVKFFCLIERKLVFLMSCIIYFEYRSLVKVCVADFPLLVCLIILNNVVF